MPVSPGVLAVGTVLALGGLTFGIDQYQDAQLKKKKAEKSKKNGKNGGTHPLSGVYAENATLAANKIVPAKVTRPIELGAMGPVSLRMPKSGDIVAYDHLVIGADSVGGTKLGKDVGLAIQISPKDATKALVTNLTSSAAGKIWTHMWEAVTKRNAAFDAPSVTADEEIVAALTKAGSNVSYANGVGTFAKDTPEVAVWRGAQTIGVLAYQTYWNRVAENEANKGGGGGGGGEPVPDAEAIAEFQQLLAKTTSMLANLKSNQDIQPPIHESFKGEGPATPLGETPEVGEMVVFSMSVLSDAMTESTGQYVGLMSYAGSGGQDGNFIIRGSTKSSMPSSLDRQNELSTKLLDIAMAKQEELYG